MATQQRHTGRERAVQALFSLENATPDDVGQGLEHFWNSLDEETSGVETTEMRRSTLQRKDREELTAIATQLGRKPPSRARKGEIIDLILDLASGGDGSTVAMPDNGDDGDGAEPEASGSDDPGDGADDADTGSGTAGSGDRAGDEAAADSRADQGQRDYAIACGGCHGAEMVDLFRGYETVERYFQFITGAMPQDDPGNLAIRQYVAIIAYLMREVGFPAGDTELTNDRELLGQIIPADGAAN